MRGFLGVVPLALLAAAACTGGPGPVAQEWHRVAAEGGAEAGNHAHRIAGATYRFTSAELGPEVLPEDDPRRAVAFGDRVAWRFEGLDPTARYRARLVLLSDQPRVQRLRADQEVLRERLELEAAPPRIVEVELPPAAFADGAVTLSLERVSGPNAVASSLELLSTRPGMLAPPDRSLALSEAQREQLQAEFERLRPVLSPRPVAVADVAAPVLRLDGTWSFHPSPEPGFADREEPAPGWVPIQVPGEWVMQGFTVEPGTAAGYVRRFELPADWDGACVRLRFDAVYSHCTVWLNGRELGSHEGGFTAFELDATGAVRPGTNTLCLAVRSESDADVLASATQYAAHPLGGILRKVTLFALPPVHLSRLDVTTEVGPDDQPPRLRFQATLAHQGTDERRALALRWQVLPLGAHAGAPLAHGIEPLARLRPGMQEGAEVSARVPGARPWDPEHPHLHRLVVDLVDGDRVLETAAVRFGFRQVEVRGVELLVNGRPVKLRGVNRHEVHPLRGRSLTEDLWRTDARLFREANCNFIRTSHYPPAEEFLAACDEVGLFVELEAPLCWVQHGANAHWGEADPSAPEYVRLLRQANLETVEQSRHHPSVILRSLANESAWSADFDRIARLMTVADPTRPLTFHDQCWGSYNNQGSDAMPVANMHYPGPDGPALAAAVGRPVLFGEYCHLNTYNRAELAADPGLREAYGRALLAMWEGIQAAEHCVGGSIWSGIDDVFLLPDGRAVGYGEWGPLDGWRRPKPEYWHLKKVFAPVRVGRAEWASADAAAPLEVEVENRHDFTDLAELTVEWSLGEASGTLRAPLPPRSRGTFLVPAPRAAAADPAVLALRFRTADGFLVDEVRREVEGPPQGPPPAALDPTTRPALRATEEEFLVQDGDVAWTLDRRTAQLSATQADEPRLLGGPALTVLPLQTGPCRPDFDEPVTPLNGACRDFQLVGLEAQEDPEGVRVSWEGTHPEGRFHCELRFPGDGRLLATWEFAAAVALDPRQVGLEFRLPGGLQTLSWERDALWTVYPEHHIGRPRGSAQAGGQGGRPTAQRREPAWPWAWDENDLGSHDFRATRRGIRWAALHDGRGAGVRVHSDGTQAVRAWRGEEGVHLLVADLDGGGGDLFLAGHYRAERHPLAPGDVLRGAAELRILPGPPPTPDRRP